MPKPLASSPLLALAIALAATPGSRLHAQTIDASTGLESPRPATQPVDVAPPTVGTDALPFDKVPGSGVRWKENAFGVSFELPLNANTGLRPSGDSLVVVTGAGSEYTADFMLRSVDLQPTEFDFLSRGVDRRPGENPDAMPRYLSQQARLQFVSEKRQLEQIDINAIVEAAIKQMGDIRPTAVLLDQRPAAIARRPGAVLYFKIPADNPGDLGKIQKIVDKQGQAGPVHRNDWVLGQAFMMLDPLTVAMFQFECEYATFADARGKFEGLLASVEKEPHEIIDKRRRGLIERGDLLLKTIKPAQVQAAMIDEQWFRIVKDNVDVGWMRVDQKAETRDKVKGYRIDMQYRLIQGDRAADLSANFFSSEDGQTEYWSSKTAVRSAKERNKATMTTVNTAGPGGKATVEKGALPAPGENAPSWIETGVHSRGKIIITRESPTSKVEVTYERPGKGFLPMATGLLASSLIPAEATGEWGFYAYDPRSGSVTFRTERVQTSPDGSRRVYTRVSPEAAELISEFGPDGKLKRKTLAGGLVLAPATKVQIASIWNFNLK